MIKKTGIGQSRKSTKDRKQTPSIVGRVTNIILNKDHEKFTQYGGYNGLGTIEFQPVNITNSTISSATPLFPQNSCFPLINELVLIFKLPYKGIGSNISEESFFYLNLISLWNHPHQNAYPSPISPNIIQDVNNTLSSLGLVNSYQLAETGLSQNTSFNDSSDEANFNSENLSQNTFIERSNIHPLLNFSGDNILQGRWGNSLRFGSTVKTDSVDNNTWSETGENGDPITILRNGQDPNSSSEGWIPITEDVNNDLASIWFTSTQKIPLTTSNNNYTSYQSEPTKPDQYTSPQVIINSDRLVFNAKTDNILMSAQESIFLGSNSSINFSTQDCVISSPSIKLGGKGASESLIKGDMFLSDLKIIVNELSVLCSQLSKIKEVSAVDVNTGKVTFTDAVEGMVAIKAKSLMEVLDGTFTSRMSGKKGYKSEVSKTL